LGVIWGGISWGWQTVAAPAPAGRNAAVNTPENTPYSFTLANFGFSDPYTLAPNNSFASVEITTLPSVPGALSDNGSAVSAGQFVSVSDINNGLLVYTPTANTYGSPYDTFTFQVEDSGNNIDPNPKTMTINVVPPSGKNNTVITPENTPYTFAAADFGFTEPTGSTYTFKAVEITTLPTVTGALTDNGTAVTAGQFVSISDINNGLLVYTPTANTYGCPYDSFTFQVEDSHNNVDPYPKTMAIIVINGPSGTNNTVTTTENTAYPFTAANFGYSDTGSSPPYSFTGVEITTLPVVGTLADNGVAVTALQFVSASDINNGLLAFAPAANMWGTPYTGFTFQVEDNGGSANGVVDTDPNPNTMTIDVTSDILTGTNNTVTTLENTAYTLAASSFGLVEPSGSTYTLNAVKITTLPAVGTLTDNGSNVTVGQFVSISDINNNLLVYNPAANTWGAPYDSFTFQVQDNGGTSGGRVDTDPYPKTMTINVLQVNNAPIGASNTITTPVNTSYTFAAADFGFTDPNDSPPNNFLAVEITTTPSTGTLYDGSTPVTAGQFVSVSDINAGLLVYIPVSNTSGNVDFYLAV
jgi:trimeric autotransporter adhesin